MTIAAGFVCSDGIVLCADSQESAGDYKFPVEKLVTDQSGLFQIAVAGAGAGSLIDMAVGRIIRAFRQDCPENYYAVEDRIADVLSALYNKEFQLYPFYQEEDRIIELLVAVKLRGTSKALLYKTSATAVSEVAEHAVIGSGRAVQYQLHKLWRGSEPSHRAITIAVSLLNVAGVVLRSVGGTGKIVSLSDNDGYGIGRLDGREIEVVRDAQNDLENAAGSLLLDLLDLGKPEEEFRESLMNFSTLAIDLRVRRVQHNEEWRELWEAVANALEGTMPQTPKQSDVQTSEDQR